MQNSMIAISHKHSAENEKECTIIEKNVLPLFLHHPHQIAKQDHKWLGLRIQLSLAHHMRTYDSADHIQHNNKFEKQSTKDKKADKKLRQPIPEFPPEHVLLECGHRQSSHSWHIQYGHRFP